MKVINLKTFRVLKKQKREGLAYRHRIMGMQKPELLQELLSYHESYQKDPHDIRVTIRGQHLMDVLEARAELRELQELAREFQSKLKARYRSQLQRMLHPSDFSIFRTRF